MAKAATYNTSGNREDLSDAISLLEPEATPLTSLAKKETATGTFVEFQADRLGSPDISGINEGEDVTSFEDKAANRAKLGNYVQVFRRSYMVSNIQQLVSTAGVPSEVSRSISHCVREIKRDFETAICSTQDRQQDQGAGSPYLTRGMMKWLGNASQPADVPVDYQCVATDATTPITETLFNGVLQDLYEANGMPGGQLTLIAGATVKKDISEFSRTSATTRNAYHVTQSADSKKVTLSVNVYDGDFGYVNVIPSTWVGRSAAAPGTAVPASALLVDPEYVAIHTLSAESRSELENQGGGQRGYCEMIAALTCTPKAHGYLT